MNYTSLICIKNQKCTMDINPKCIFLILFFDGTVPEETNFSSITIPDVTITSIGLPEESTNNESSEC